MRRSVHRPHIRKIHGPGSAKARLPAHLEVSLSLFEFLRGYDALDVDGVNMWSSFALRAFQFANLLT